VHRDHKGPDPYFYSILRRLFNKSRTERTSQNWELHKEAQRRYRKEVRKASKHSWRAFCNSINDLPTSVRLHRVLSRDPKTKLGSLVTPSGLQTQSEGETSASLNSHNCTLTFILKRQ
jgi:hypothetical protein